MAMVRLKVPQEVNICTEAIRVGTVFFLVQEELRMVLLMCSIRLVSVAE